MKKSINGWSIPGDVSFEDMFAKISKAGFDGIELNLDMMDGPAQGHSLSAAMTDSEIDAIVALSKKYSLPVVSISSSLYGGNLGSADPAERETGKNIMRAQIKFAQKLGADGILAVPGGIGGKVSYMQAHENSLATVIEMKDEIMAGGIFVGLENVWNGFFMSPFDMRNFIDAVDCPLVGAYFDVGNVAVTSAPEHWIEVLGSRIKKVHVKDFNCHHGRYSGWFVNLLEGTINWENAVNALKKAGFDGYLTAELDIMRQCPDYLYDITSAAIGIIIDKIH